MSDISPSTLSLACSFANSYRIAAFIFSLRVVPNICDITRAFSFFRTARGSPEAVAALRLIELTGLRGRF